MAVNSLIRLRGVVLLAILGLPRAEACSCAPPPPPCQAYAGSPLIFLGTVTEVLSERDGHVVRARMRIDRAYKGITEQSVELFDDGMCDGPALRLGEQYLMYTHRLGTGAIPSRGCTRSRHVKYAQEDLAYLNSLADAKPVSKVSGRVVVRTNDYYGDDRPLPGAKVEISRADDRATTITDAEGRYRFENLQPSTYSIGASADGFKMLLFGGDPPAATVEPRGCAEVDIIMRRNWQGRVAGRILRSNGAPAPAGIDLTLIQLQVRDGVERSNLLFGSGVQTNERGEYAFEGVAPGRYQIVMNLYRFPTAVAPYPTLYWPGSRDEAGAKVIVVPDGPVEQSIDFTLPAEPKSVRVNGVVIGPDGKPAPGARVIIIALPANSRDRNDENRPRTDAEGRFSFTALQGYDYRLTALVEGNRRFHSADQTFNLKTGLTSITLLCDRPGRFENDPAELRR